MKIMSHYINPCQFWSASPSPDVRYLQTSASRKRSTLNMTISSQLSLPFPIIYGCHTSLLTNYLILNTIHPCMTILTMLSFKHISIILECG